MDRFTYCLTFAKGQNNDGAIELFTGKQIYIIIFIFVGTMGNCTLVLHSKDNTIGLSLESIRVIAVYFL
jgi:hypothetical protein